MILPLLGSRMRVNSRPAVDLPQPDSPTRPSVSPWRTCRSMPSTARTAPTCRLNRPLVIGKCFSSPETSSRFSLISTSLRSEVRQDFLLEDLGALLLREVTGDRVGPAAQHRHLG